MDDKELKSWRLIVQVLYDYGLGDLLAEEIDTVKKCLERCEKDK